MPQSSSHHLPQMTEQADSPLTSFVSLPLSEFVSLPLSESSFSFLFWFSVFFHLLFHKSRQLHRQPSELVAGQQSCAGLPEPSAQDIQG